MSKGWVCLHRSIQDHWLWQEKTQFTKRDAWIDILMSAAHKETKVYIKDSLVSLEPGEWIASVRFLQKRWKWSNSKVVRFLAMIENDDMIQITKKTGVSVLKVRNYKRYQMPEKTKKTEKRQEKDTQATPKRHLSDKDNNDNNENTHTRPSLDDVIVFASQPNSIPITKECAEAWFFKLEENGWVTTQGFPVKDWRASLRKFASYCRQNGSFQPGQKGKVMNFQEQKEERYRQNLKGCC